MNSIKFVSIVAFCAQFSMMQATWIIVKIDNQSDLTFVQAARSDNNVEIQSISQVLTKSADLKLIKLDADAFFGSSGGCKIIAQTPAGNQIAISFFGDVTHRVANGRARYTDLDSRNAAAIMKKTMMARIFMMQDDVMKLIGYAGYDNDRQQFALKLTGSNGNYQAKLSLA